METKYYIGKTFTSYQFGFHTEHCGTYRLSFTVLFSVFRSFGSNSHNGARRRFDLCNRGSKSRRGLNGIHQIGFADPPDSLEGKEVVYLLLVHTTLSSAQCPSLHSQYLMSLPPCPPAAFVHPYGNNTSRCMHQNKINKIFKCGITKLLN